MTLHTIQRSQPQPARDDSVALRQHLLNLLALHSTYTPDPANRRVKIGPVWFHFELDGLVMLRNEHGVPLKTGRQTPVKRQVAYHAPRVGCFMALMGEVYRAASLIVNQHVTTHTHDIPGASENAARRTLSGPGWHLVTVNRPFGPLGGNVYRFTKTTMKGAMLTD